MTSTQRDDRADDHPDHRLGEAGRAPLLVLGANGPTGRQVVRQALARGHRVDALTRHPEGFPLQHDRLRVIAGDATDADVIDAAVAGSGAVVCAIGAAFTRQPVRVYSASARLLVAAMGRHGHRRLVVVTSAGLTPTPVGSGAVSSFFRRVMRDVVGRSVYDDMAAMEAVVSASDLDWTVVRPPGLVSEPGRGYEVAETEVEGALCSREDLAAMLLDQIQDDRFVRRVAAVVTPGLHVSAWYMLRREVLKR